MDLLAIIFAAIMGAGVGWRLREVYAIRKVDSLLKQVQDMEQETSEAAERMRLERHGEVIYAYTVEDDSFIAQGSSLEELDAAIQKRFPGKKFLIKESNLAEIGLES